MTTVWRTRAWAVVVLLALAAWLGGELHALEHVLEHGCEASCALCCVTATALAAAEAPAPGAPCIVQAEEAAPPRITVAHRTRMLVASTPCRAPPLPC